jgi:hypothetical protein
MPLIAEDPSPIRAGKWEMTMEMEMPGMPVKMPPVKVVQCVTPEQAANPEKGVPTGGKSTCQIKDMKVSGNTISYTVICPEEKVTAEAEMTYTGDSFSGFMKMKVEGQDQEITTKYSGKRIGDC